MASHLCELPWELQCHVFAMADNAHAYHFSLAHPRLGWDAIARMPRYRRLLIRNLGVVDEALFRQYLFGRDATYHDICVLNAVAATQDTTLVVANEPYRNGILWCLFPERTLLRIDYAQGITIHFEGQQGEERKVREVSVEHDYVLHMVGPAGYECKWCVNWSNGESIEYYQGTQDQESLFQVQYRKSTFFDSFFHEYFADELGVDMTGVSHVEYYTGAAGEERLFRVQAEAPTGGLVVAEFKGRPGQERLIRIRHGEKTILCKHHIRYTARRG